MSFVPFRVKVLTASLMFVSATGLAFAANYKGERMYKGEVAVPCPPQLMLKDGFYVGGAVGYDSYRVRQTFDLVDLEMSGNPVLSATGWNGGLFLGYGRYLTDLFYLGGEIFGNWSSADTNYTFTSAGTNYNTKFKARGGYGLSLLPGIRLNNTSLGYIRLGYNWVNLKSTETVTPATAGFPSTSDSNTSGGFNYGVGIETLVYDNWSVRGEYTHTKYSSFSSSMGAGTKFSPSNNQFMLGLLYHFG